LFWKLSLLLSSGKIKKILKSTPLGPVAGGKLQSKTFFLTSEVMEEVNCVHHLDIAVHCTLYMRLKASVISQKKNLNAGWGSESSG
jgi:hypothetical protein